MPEELPDADDGVPERTDAATPSIVLEQETEEPSTSRRFAREYFPNASPAQWNDWKWQVRNRIRDLSSLERIVDLTIAERGVIEQIGGRLPVGITPYYASLMDLSDAEDPIRKTIVPIGSELLRTDGEAEDPLGEDHDSVVPGLVHRYPDRVLFLVTNFCAVYCRYCTRARLVGHTGEFHFSVSQHKAAIDYIASHPEIRDVLISGGDPLTMADDRLEQLLAALRAIPHVEFLRIGTKVPAVLPQRITPAFVAMLKRYHPLWMSIHFMHPAEITPEVSVALNRLADAGVPMGSQTVLVKGVNDDVPTMKKLMHGLLKNRVRPYYIYQCDPIVGSSHLRTPVSKGLEIIAGLRGHTTGYAVPAFVVDAPGGGGKIQLLPDSVVGRDGDDLILRNFEGNTYRYPDPLQIEKGAGRILVTHTTGAGGRRIGMTYDLRADYLALGYGEEETAEFDRISTVEALEKAIADAGHTPVRIGNVRALVAALGRGETWDAVLNVCEGLSGFGREAQVPAILDAFGLSYTFADPLTACVTLHKGTAKRVLRDAGVPTTDFAIVASAADAERVSMPFPLFVKPVAEGTAKGIHPTSRVLDREQLVAVSLALIDRYHQPVIVEPFLPGREFTTAIRGEGAGAEVIGTMEVVLLEGRAESHAYTYLNKEESEERCVFPMVEGDDARRCGEVALAAWRALGCRDAGRVDLREDGNGQLMVMEANPLPGMHPEHSDLPMICTASGMPYGELVRFLVEAALSRAR